MRLPAYYFFSKVHNPKFCTLLQSKKKNMIQNTWNLIGKTALITGSTKGIGRAVAEEMALLGAEVLIVSRNPEEVATFVKELREQGKMADGMGADIATTAGRNELLIWISQRDKLDILVNNVGTNIRKKMVDYSETEYNFIMQTNLHSNFALSTPYPMKKIMVLMH